MGAQALTDPARQLAKIISDLNSRWQPHPAQRKILNALFGRMESVVFSECGRKFGKALALDTPIPTPDGWKLMGDIQDGDTVFDERGKPTRVIQAHDVLNGLKCYSVKFSDGSEIKACADHRWLTHTKATRKSDGRRRYYRWKHTIPSVVTTEEIRQTLTKGKEWNHSIPPTKALDLPPVDLPLDPYVLGAWLGDGSRDGGRFTGIDVEIVDEIRAVGFLVNQGKTNAQAWFIRNLKPTLIAMKLFKNKHVPAAYLRGSFSQRLSLLQGLMDTDGTASKAGRCSFDNKNEGIARAVFELAVSIGARPLWRSRIPKCNGKACARSYRVYFQTEYPVFRLARKLARQKATKKSGHRFIVAVDPIESEPMRCLTVDSPSSLYLAGRAMIPTHNTEVIAYFLWRLALTKPGGYYYFAPEQKQAKEIFWAAGRLQTFGPPDYIQGEPNNTEMRIRLTNGSFIKVDGSDNFNSHRGTEPHGCVYDEFRDFRPEFHQVMGPNLGVYTAPLLICSTPPEQMVMPNYDNMMIGLEPGKSYFNYPTWENPHMPKAWLDAEKAKLYARGEGDVWEREYGARRVRGGSNSIFPMFDPAKHVWPHAGVMEAVRRDRKKLIWQVVCDPGNSTVFAVLFRAINPYTKVVYRLGEIYERNQGETSTSRIVPRIQAMKEALCPGYEAYGIEWDQFYDEAATWFAVEAQNSYDETFVATRKASSDINEGLSLLKDQMLHGLTVVSDRCTNFIREYENFIRDPANGKPRKDCDDHAIDCDRYGNDLAGVDLRPEAEPSQQDPDDRPRFKTPEQDLRDSREADDFTGLDDF